MPRQRPSTPEDWRAVAVAGFANPPALPQRASSLCQRWRCCAAAALNPRSVFSRPRHAGAGKSSLIGALLRLHAIDAGRVLVGGHDAAGMPLRDLRRCFGIVPQASCRSLRRASRRAARASRGGGDAGRRTSVLLAAATSAAHCTLYLPARPLGGGLPPPHMTGGGCLVLVPLCCHHCDAQTPFLFTGTVRDNLDPQGACSSVDLVR